MFAPSVVLAVILGYMALLFVVAQWAEHRATTTGRNNHPLIYALSYNVYSTSWAFYGAVGFAVGAGWMFTAFDSGVIFGMLFAALILRKMVRLKQSFRLTSIADLLSTRYNRSQSMATGVTLVLLFGVIPYIALQLKAVVATFALLTVGPQVDSDGDWSGVLVVVLMTLFTVIFGVRRLDPTERHQGMMAALALECVVKLLALIVVGVFVTFILHDGVGHLFSQLADADRKRLLSFNAEAPVLQWSTNFVLGFVVIYLLPRQFHIGVVENASERHLMWLICLLPLYLILIKLFVLPLAAAGIVLDLPRSQADSFVLLIPQEVGSDWLALLVFMGGFSAATAMVMVSTMTLSTMVSNHLLLPLLESSQALKRMRRHLLQCRWGIVALIMVVSYGFTLIVGESQMLISLGSLSFVGLIQLAPATLGALYWPRGNRVGALLGLSAGVLIWLYTMLIPQLVDQGWIATKILIDGPANIHWLRPEALFGLDVLPHVTHSLLWSISVNCLLYVTGSFYFLTPKSERELALQFVNVRAEQEWSEEVRPTGLREYISLAPKLTEAQQLLNCYLAETKTARLLQQIIDDLGIEGKSQLTMMELVEFHWRIEQQLSGSIGAPAAHRAMEAGIHYTEREATELKIVHNHILAELQCLPTHPEAGAVHHADRPDINEIAGLQAVISGLEQQVQALEERLEKEREKDFDRRLEIQRLKTEKRDLQHMLAEIDRKKEIEEWGRTPKKRS